MNTLASTPTSRLAQRLCALLAIHIVESKLPPHSKQRCGGRRSCGGATIAAHPSELAAGSKQTVRSFLFITRGHIMLSLSYVHHRYCHLVLSVRLRASLARRGSKACPYPDGFYRCSSALRVAGICEVGPCHDSATQRMSAGL